MQREKFSLSDPRACIEDCSEMQGRGYLEYWQCVVKVH